MPHPPRIWTLDVGMADLDDLRNLTPYGPPSQAISEQTTVLNFRGWFCIQLAPEASVHEEQNVCYDLWIVAVEVGGSCLVGYVETAESA